MPHKGLPAGCIHEVKGASLASALAFSAILSMRSAGAKATSFISRPTVPCIHWVFFLME